MFVCTQRGTARAKLPEAIGLHVTVCFIIIFAPTSIFFNVTLECFDVHLRFYFFLFVSLLSSGDSFTCTCTQRDVTHHTTILRNCTVKTEFQSMPIDSLRRASLCFPARGFWTGTAPSSPAVAWLFCRFVWLHFHDNAVPNRENLFDPRSLTDLDFDFDFYFVIEFGQYLSVTRH